MVFLREEGQGWGWAGLLLFSLSIQQQVVGQATCIKPDAGLDVTTSVSSIKLKNAPAGYFWFPQTGNPGSTATINAQTGEVTGITTPGRYQFVMSSIASSIDQHAPQVIPQDGALRANTINGLDMLDNGQIKVGVNSRYGGAITYLSTKTGTNMVNNYDLGRQAQIGIYAGPVPFKPPGVEIFPAWSGIGWNPIQAGDFYNNVSRILAYEKRENLIYVKTLPKFWPLRNYDGEAIIEHWIRLSGNVVKVHARVTLARADKKQYVARDQEFPCLYLNSIYKRSWKYSGTAPFTNADKQLKVGPFEMVNVRASEPWVALTRDDDFGVGLYTPKNQFFREAFFGDEFSNNEFGSSASYITASPFAVLDHNSVTDFDYELIVGHINDIRSHVYAQPRPDAGPNYRFNNSRHSWYYVETTDTGLPITNNLNITLDGNGSKQLKSPAVFWRGQDNPKLYIRAAFDLKGGNTYRLHWQTQEDYEFLGLKERTKDFTVINDGQFHTYEIDLTGTPWTASSIRQVMFSPPWDGPALTGTFKLEWFATKPNGPTAPPAQTSATVCTDTVQVNYNPPVVSSAIPNAGPDQVLRCGVTSVDLPLSSPELTWRILSRPTGSAATVTPTGAARGLQMPGFYLLTLSNDVAKTVDLMAITVSSCAVPQSLTSSVFLDTGSGGGIARNGKQEPGEPGVANVRVTLYTDPNGDGNPTDGVVVERTQTNSRGQYRFIQLFANEFYVIALDVSNFAAGGPLHRKVSTRQNSYNPQYGLLSGRIILQSDKSEITQARAKVADSDPTFGLEPDCSNRPASCLTIQSKRL